MTMVSGSPAASTRQYDKHKGCRSRVILMPGRPSPLSDPATVHALSLYFSALQHSIPSGPFSQYVDPRVSECCAVTGLSIRKVRTAFAHLGIKSKEVTAIEPIENRLGSFEEIDRSPQVRELSEQIVRRRETIKRKHFQVSLRATTIRAEKKEAARAAAWRERRHNESLEEYRLRLEEGDPIVIAQQRAAIASARRRIKALEAACPLT